MADSDSTRGERNRRRAIRAASVLFLLNFVSAAGMAYPVVHMATTRTFLPRVLWASRPLSGFFGQPQALDVMIALGLLWIAESLIQGVAGYWLWKSLRRGGVLGAFLVPVGIFFGIGLGAPAYPIIHSVQVILLALGWKSLQPESRPDRQMVPKNRLQHTFK